MVEVEEYDLVIIGSGPSGYAAAMRAVDYQKKTLMIEKTKLGGAGITNGALSSKTWWELARETRNMNENLKNHNIPPPEIHFEDLKIEVQSAVNEKINLLKENLESLMANTHNKLSFRMGTAKIVDRHSIEILDKNGRDIVKAKHIILATGSRPRKLPHIPIDEKIIMTSDGIENMDDFPESMVILGAGVIGCEFATIFSGFGKTKVHLIDKGDRILPFEDDDIVRVIEQNMEKNGVYIHRNSQLIRMEIKIGKVEYELEYSDGSNEIFHVDKALISVGRVPNYEGLFDESLNIKLDNRGIVDNDTQTSISNIYAVGDITADIALVNVGELEGRYAVERIFGKPSRKLVYENISTIMFLNPEVAGVGMNEIQARDKGCDFKVVTLDYKCISRAVAKRNTQGFIKLLITKDEKMKILGMRVVGIQASSAIQAVALLISMDKGIEELAECVHPHPSITEGIQECVRMFLNKSLLKPSALDGKLTLRECCNGLYTNLAMDQ